MVEKNFFFQKNPLLIVLKIAWWWEYVLLETLE